jgi:hypothetical protein
MQLTKDKILLISILLSNRYPAIGVVKLEQITKELY